MNRILTLDTLATLGACLGQCEKFRTLFGDQVEVSVERFSRLDVIQAGFDFDWAADLLLGDEERGLYFDELEKRRQALKVEYSVLYYHQISRDLRIRLKPLAWAEFYAKSTYVPPIKAGRVNETPVEESIGGY